MKLVYGLLRVVMPKWLATDVYNYLTHPYWRKQVVDTQCTDRVVSGGITSKMEKTSRRRAFKRENRKKVLKYFRDANVKTVLDIGCSIGNLVRDLEAEGFEAFGVTINPSEVEQAKHKNILLHDIQSRLEGSALDGMCFDAVISFDCLEHLDSPLVGLKNINRLLKPNGLFICHLPPVRWIECDYHIIVYTPRQFRWLLNLAGFDLLEREGRYRMSKKGTSYYTKKVKSEGMVYPGILE
ncbi:MAG: class I SAM-dependent methyltransferase [Planctomycetota bacterium]|jgi:2-polyprenyl-3-methyl-5-hydroxy-6-metoxy-1,4-benzoquinol methylase